MFDKILAINTGNVSGFDMMGSVPLCTGFYWNNRSGVLMKSTGLAFASGITYAQSMQDTNACYVGYFKIDKNGPIEAGTYDSLGKNIWTTFSDLSTLKTVGGVWSDYLVIKMPSNYITSVVLSNWIGVISRTGQLIVEPKPIVETSLRYEGDGRFTATRYDSVSVEFTK